MTQVQYNSPDRLVAGHGIPVRVNLSFGSERLQANSREIRKLNGLIQADHGPDLLMDLSVASSKIEAWQAIRDDFSGPIGLLPHYLNYSDDVGLNPVSLMRRIRKVVEGGINFLTVHCTPSLELLNLAKQRGTPVTSRGGGIVIRDMLQNGRRESVFTEIFPDLCELSRETGCVINLGTAFRAASVADGLDDTCIAEIDSQARFIHQARSAGATVVLEGPGHIQMHQIQRYWRLIEPLEVVPMPLGPLVTDSNSNMDHIASAIGAATLMQLSRGGIINAITRMEHQGGVPSLSASMEGLHAARIAAQAASIAYSDTCLHAEKEVAHKRATIESCVIGANQPGCTRCNTLCPLVTSSYRNSDAVVIKSIR